jgi:hypothetical protein
MGCRIKYAMRKGLLCAILSGKTSDENAAWIARSIAEQADKATVDRVLIDVRRLGDRLGRLGTLAMATGEARAVEGYRVAVVDVKEYDAYYVFHEVAAKARGFALRCFSDTRDALVWLRYAAD